MSGHFQLIVLGGGPAGVAAALEADARGLVTLLIDEGEAAGGQVYRAPAAGIGAAPADRDRAAGDALRRGLAASGVTCAFAQRAWLLEPGFAVHTLGPDGPHVFTGDALVLATGALERHIPIPGWTLPGVLGLAAATVMLKSQAMLPGRRVLVAGSGPLLALVAASILKGGGAVAGLVDVTPRRAWLAQMPGLVSQPGLAARGALWLARLVAAGVPVLSGHAVARISGEAAVTGAEIVALDRTGAPRPGAAPRTIACDTVCYGFGLLPATEASRLLGAEHVFAPDMGGWVPRLDPAGRTSVARLYAAGDGAGVLGAAAAPLRGRLAALAAAHDLGVLDAAGWQQASAPLHRDLGKAARFGRAMTALATPPAALAGAMGPGTVVCRCEGITRASLDAAIAGGAVTMNDLKAATRCGMGPCGGRVCAEPAAMLLAAATGRDRAAIAEATARPPLRPMPIGRLAGDFDYDDLPIPAPAPL